MKIYLKKGKKICLLALADLNTLQTLDCGDCETPTHQYTGTPKPCEPTSRNPHGCFAITPPSHQKTPMFLVSTNLFENFQNFTPCVVRSTTNYKRILTHTVLTLLVLDALWMFIPCSLMLCRFVGFLVFFLHKVLCVPILK